MGFERPQVLMFLMLVPPVVHWLRTGTNWIRDGLRAVVLILSVMFLAGPYVNREQAGVDVIVVADRSASMAKESSNRLEEILGLVSKARGGHDRLGLVSFGGEAAVEFAPSREAGFAAFKRVVDPNGSNLTEALRLAGRLISPLRRTRLLLLSDGLHTGEEPTSTNVLSEFSRTEIWYRHIGRSRIGDIAAGEIHLPPAVPLNAGFLVRLSVEAVSSGKCRYVLSRNGTPLSKGTVALKAGSNSFFVRDLIEEGDRAEYSLAVSAEHDLIPENNVSRALLTVVQPPGVLLVNADGRAGILGRALADAGISVDCTAGEGLPGQAAMLQPYRVIVLENVPLGSIGLDGVRAVAQMVESGVCGLLVSGGEGSFGPGGYHKSPLDPLLPVSMELREEQRRGVMALAVVLDRSGSMSAAMGGGRTKMDLANAASAEAVRLLSPLDQISVIAVDSSAHVIVPLVHVTYPGDIIQAVLKIESLGGGIFVRTALEAAEKELDGSSLPTRHIILFSDARDSEEQGGCLPLMKRLHKEGTGLSVVGLGRPTDCDAQFLGNLAKAAGGEAYFTDRPEDLPRIFSREVIRVSRRGFVKEPTKPKALADMALLGLNPGVDVPAVAGYNLTSLRKGASCAAITTDDYSAPLIAHQRKGKASCAALMLEVDGEFSGGFGAWDKTPDLLVNISRLLASEATIVDVKSRSELHRGLARVVFEFEPALARSLQAQPLSLSVIPPPGGKPLTVPVEWEEPDRSVALFCPDVPGHYLPVLDLGEQGAAKAPSLTLSYSPEFAPLSAGMGEPLLAELAERTGGTMMGEPSALFDPSGLRAEKTRLDISPWVLTALLFFLLLEIADRRTGIVTTFGRLIPKGRLHRKKRASPGAGDAAAGTAETGSSGRHGEPVVPEDKISRPKTGGDAASRTGVAEQEKETEGGVDSVLRQIRQRRR